MEPGSAFFMVKGEEGLRLLELHLAGLTGPALEPQALRQLDFWADCAESHGFWRGALRLFLLLAAYHAAGGERERCAYRINDVGILLENAGDPRCIDVYHRALALTRDPLRRLRTLMRLGRAHLRLRGDRPMSRRCLTAAVIVGWSLGERGMDLELAEAQLKSLVGGELPKPPAPDEELVKAAAMFDPARLPARPR